MGLDQKEKIAKLSQEVEKGNIKGKILAERIRILEKERDFHKEIVSRFKTRFGWLGVFLMVFTASWDYLAPHLLKIRWLSIRYNPTFGNAQKVLFLFGTTLFLIWMTSRDER